MAKTTEPAEPETTYVEIDGEQFETKSVEHGGKTYVVRELGVQEGDDISDAATDQDGKFNERLNLRLCLSKAIVSPPTTVDDIGKWPGKRYVVVSRVFNALNTVPN